MEKVCATCGMALPREDARFCSVCGTLVNPHPDDSARQDVSSVAPSSPASVAAPPRRRHELREQIAQQPGAWGTQHERPEEPPYWMSQLETSLEKVSRVPQQKSSQRELRVKVWKTEESAKVEELDTAPLEAAIEAAQPREAETATESRALADEETMQLAIATNDEAVISPPQAVLPQQAALPAAVPAHNTLMPALPPGMLMPAMVPPTPLLHGITAPAYQRPRRRKRSLLFLVLAFLTLLVLGGGVWLWYYQPFSVAAITQTQQKLTARTVGVTLFYPTGWQSRLDQPSANVATLSLSDSSHTAQFVVKATHQDTSDVAQYLKLQATHQGMTNSKNESAITFAGAVWQQMQGNVSQGGANYSETLLATRHGNTLLLIIEAAPQSVYNDEESSIFSPMRSSMQFLA